MRLTKLILLFAIVCSLLTGCSETKEPTPYTYTQVFTGRKSKTWKLDQWILRQSGKSDVNITGQLYPCEKDDLYIFYANGEKKFEVKNGTQVCSSSDGNLLLTYHWEFNQANATLSMVFPQIPDFGYYFIPFTVKQAKNDKVELEIFFNEEATVSYVLVLKRVSEE